MRLHYYLLAGLNIGANGVSIALIYLVYGKGVVTSIFFLGNNFVFSSNLIILTFIEQFSYHYSRKLYGNQLESDRFFSAVLIMVICIAALFFCVICINLSTIVKIWMPALDNQHHELAANVTKWMSISIIYSTPLYILQQRSNCLGLLVRSYMLSLIPSLAQALILNAARIHQLKLDFVVIGNSIVGMLTLAFAVLLECKSLKCPDRFEFNTVFKMVIESARIRTAHNIHNYFSLYLINISAVSTPLNLSAIFFGIKRCIDAFLQIATGPFIKTLPSEIIKMIADKNHNAVLNRLENHSKNMIRLYLLVGIICIIVGCVTVQFGVFSKTETLYASVSLAFLLLYALQISIEVPFAIVCSAYGDSFCFFKSNMLFIVLLSVFVICLCQYKVFELLSIGMGVSQLVVLINNRAQARKSLSRRRPI
jgi:hypothetical protein